MSNRNEITEYRAMEVVDNFLQKAGLVTNIQWERPDSNVFPDYWGEVNNQRWAFEITRLMKFDDSAFVKIRTASDLENLSHLIIPQVPTDAKTFRRRVEKAISVKSQEKRLSLLNGAQYCLVLINEQFHFAEMWEEGFGDFDVSAFDSVIVVHCAVPFGYEQMGDSIPPASVCEVFKNGFEVSLPQYGLCDLMI